MEQARLLSFILVKQLSQVKSEQTNELNVKSLKSFEVSKVIVNKDKNLSPETQLHSFWSFFMYKKTTAPDTPQSQCVLQDKTCQIIVEILFTYSSK